MTYLNWPEICMVENVHFRLAICFSNDPEFLGKIAQVFPNLFTETEPENNGPFPLSYLKRVADAWCAKSGEDRSTLHQAMDEVGIPSVLMAHPDSDIYDPGECLPLTLKDQEYAELRKKYVDGVCFPYELNRAEVYGVAYYTGWVNGEGVKDTDHKEMYLFPADLVDIGS
jgi:hypothetical protein